MAGTAHSMASDDAEAIEHEFDHMFTLVELGAARIRRPRPERTTERFLARFDAWKPLPASVTSISSTFPSTTRTTSERSKAKPGAEKRKTKIGRGRGRDPGSLPNHILSSLNPC